MSTNSLNTQTLIERYEGYIDSLSDDEMYYLEAELALFTRDAIENSWAELSHEQRDRVNALDDDLVGYRERVGVASEDLAVDQPRDRWWWYLHEDRFDYGRNRI